MRDIIIIEGAPQIPASDGPLHDQSTPITLADGDQRCAVECEYLVGWQGPGPARARLIREIEARHRKAQEARARRPNHLPGR
jgi:hypothetical protein